ncbi:MAG: nicotinate-nucleotide adenylyltransferase [Thiotrichales bacterium]|nr:nicotinate-nucleotide adenylyltransferase [Thiotrichales bacterium]
MTSGRSAPLETIGILGGTFDPVHCAHLRLALEVRAAVGLDTVRLMPAPSPRLRHPPDASAEVRMRLLEAAVADIPGLEADGRELSHPGPTVTADTLQAMREELPGASLCLILGMDAISRLDDWIEFERIPSLAHIVVADRPGATAPPPDGNVAHLLRARQRDNPGALRAAPSGFVYFVRDIPTLDISATRVRSLRARGESIRFLVPDRVHDIIVNEDIYAHQR